MPIYEYTCTFCHHTQDEYQRMSDPAGAVCVNCGAASQRQVSLPHTDLKAFHTPIEMYSIAMEDPAQIREFKVKCPDVECSDDPRSEMYGIPIAVSRHAKLQALAGAGFIETK